MKDDDNFFDDDDALDYCLYEEMTKDSQDNQNKPGKAGCFGALALVLLPGIGIGYCLLKFA